MARRKTGPTIDEILANLYTVEEAQEWLETHKLEFGLTKVPTRDTLKRACQHKRLGAVLKGSLYLTRESELREYMAHYDPKNKSENRPLKPRTLKRREKIGEQPASET